MKYSLSQKEVLSEAKDMFKVTKQVQISEKDMDKVRKGFINLMIKDILFYRDRFQKDYGEILIASDYSKATYWRKSIHPTYKISRDKERPNAFEDAAWKNFGKDKEIMLEMLRNLNVRVLDRVICESEEYGKETVEADDIIGVLVRTPGRHIILSSDGDFDQLLVDPRIRRFNLLSGKLEVKTKKEIHEKNQFYLIMGQSKDDIPHVKDKSELSEDFIKWMKEKYQIELKPDMASLINSSKYDSYTKEYEKLMYEEDSKLLQEGKRKKRRNLTAYNKPNFGEVTYESTFSSMTVDEFLNLNPIYRKNYELNKLLYLLENIPKRIIEAIGRTYLSSIVKLDQASVQPRFLEFGIDTLLIHKFK